MDQLQLNLIVRAINAILAEARAQLRPLDDLIDSDYAHSRKNHYITALVYSAFPDGSQIGEMQVRKRRYGNGLSLPEFLDGDRLYQLYSSAAKPYATIEVISRVAEYGQRFELLEFTLSEASYMLTKLDLVSFRGLTPGNNRASIDNRLTLYESGASHQENYIQFDS